MTARRQMWLKNAPNPESLVAERYSERLFLKESFGHCMEFSIGV